MTFGYIFFNQGLYNLPKIAVSQINSSTPRHNVQLTFISFQNHSKYYIAIIGTDNLRESHWYFPALVSGICASAVAVKRSRKMP